MADYQLRPGEPGNRAGSAWTIDEYVVVADLYLRRQRSSNASDREVVEIAGLLRRSPASVSWRLGNFAGSNDDGRGAKPVTGPALDVYRLMQSSDEVRTTLTGDARRRLAEHRETASHRRSERGVTFVAPEAFSTRESSTKWPEAATALVRAESELVHRYRTWRDAGSTVLRGVIIRTEEAHLRCDLYDSKRHMVIEAKLNASREKIRYAIGQLLDYVRYFERPSSMGLLVPTRLSDELLALLGNQQVTAIWQHHGKFVELAPSRG